MFLILLVVESFLIPKTLESFTTGSVPPDPGARSLVGQYKNCACTKDCGSVIRSRPPQTTTYLRRGTHRAIKLTHVSSWGISYVMRNKQNQISTQSRPLAQTKCFFFVQIIFYPGKVFDLCQFTNPPQFLGLHT